MRLKFEVESPEFSRQRGSDCRLVRPGATKTLARSRELELLEGGGFGRPAMFTKSSASQR